MLYETGEVHTLGSTVRVNGVKTPYPYPAFAHSITGNNNTLRQAMIDSGHVHIHQFKPDGAILDTAALGKFQQQWATYGKLVSTNSLSYCEVTGNLPTLSDVAGSTGDWC